MKREIKLKKRNSVSLAVDYMPLTIIVYDIIKEGTCLLFLNIWMPVMLDRVDTYFVKVQTTEPG